MIQLKFVFALLLSLPALMAKGESCTNADVLNNYYSQNEHSLENSDYSKMIPFRQSELWGFVENQNGYAEIIKPQYKSVKAVFGTYAIVEMQNEKLGVINSKGATIIEPSYQTIAFEGELIHCISEYPEESDKRKWGLKSHTYFNFKGDFIFRQDAYNFESFNKRRDLAWFDNQDIYFYNRKGQMLKKVNNEGGKLKEPSPKVSGKLLLTTEVINFENYFIAKDLDGKISYKTPLTLPQYSDANPVDYFKISDEVYIIKTIENHSYYNSEPYFQVYRSNGTYLGNIQQLSYYNDWNSNKTIDFSEDNYFTISTPDYQTIIINKQGTIVYKTNSNECIRISQDEFWLMESFGNSKSYINLSDSSNFFPSYFLRKEMIISEERIQLGFYDDLFLSMEQSILSDTLENGHVNFYTEGCYYSEGNFFYFNKAGERVITLSQDILYANRFSEGLACLLKNTDKERKRDFGDIIFIDKSGKEVITISGIFYVAHDIVFKNGLAYIPGKGLIDKKGYRFWKD